MIKFYSKNNYIYILLIFISLLGLFTYKHYGIGIEEHFQRKSGFYWLNYVLGFTPFDGLNKPKIILDKVVFPQPVLPTIATRSPSLISKLKFEKNDCS